MQSLAVRKSCRSHAAASLRPMHPILEVLSLTAEPNSGLSQGATTRPEADMRKRGALRTARTSTNRGPSCHLFLPASIKLQRIDSHGSTSPAHSSLLLSRSTC